LRASCTIRGPDVAVGVPKAAAPMFCGTRHGVPAIPQTVVDVEREKCVVRTPLKRHTRL